MKRTLLSLVFGFAVISAGYAQQEKEEVAENFSTHNIAMGETVLVIAKKYKITPRDIYDYNPDAIEGITPNGLLRIPLHRQLQPKETVAAKDNKEVREEKKEVRETFTPAPVAPEKKTEVAVVAVAESAPQPQAEFVPQTMQTLQHTVQSGETLYSLSRKYNTKVADIQKENASKLKNGLETGTVLSITTIPRAGDPDKYVTHSVASGETLYSLSRKYNTSVEAITESNRVALKKGLQKGQHLMILPGNAVTTANPDSYIATTEKVTPGTTVQHTVQNGETLMGLANKYNTTVDDITAANRNKLTGDVKAGQILTIRNNASLSTVTE
jgi:LysM repeat protein